LSHRTRTAPPGDSKSGWRGFQDGQFNITFDGLPFGDLNDPPHHSAANFPGIFIGQINIDRGPGPASQIGYATFGGTMALNSRELSNKASTEIGGSIGNYGTYTANVTQQTGLVGGDTRVLVQAAYQKTDGAIDYGHVDTQNVLFKLDKKLDDDWKLTLFASLNRQNYNNIAAPKFQQLQLFGRKYGEINNDATTQQYYGYNNSEKRTDLEYICLEGTALGWHIDNKAYTYAYDYPANQNNGNDQTNIAPASPTVTSVKITNPNSGCLQNGVATSLTCQTVINFSGIHAGDVTGFLKFNNYRVWGDTIDLKKNVDAGILSGSASLRREMTLPPAKIEARSWLRSSPRQPQSLSGRSGPRPFRDPLEYQVTYRKVDVPQATRSNWLERHPLPGRPT